METLRSGLSALTVGDCRNYQVSPAFSETRGQGSGWRLEQQSGGGGVWRGDLHPEQCSPMLSERLERRAPPVWRTTEPGSPVEFNLRNHARNTSEAPELNQRNFSRNTSEAWRNGDMCPPCSQDTEETRSGQNARSRFNHRVCKDSKSGAGKLEGFNSMELRRFGVLDSKRPNSPGMVPYKQRVRAKNKTLEERNQSSDSCYSKSDNSSTHSEPPRVPSHPSLNSSVRQYDTTSLSSIDTTSSSDLWNVRAMPNVRIIRLDRPVYLRPNPTSRTRPSVFDLLTDELVVRILAYLTTKELMTTARVSRKFYFLSWEPQLWRSINLSGEQGEADRALSAIFQIINKNGVNIASTVKTIFLNGCSRLTDRGLALIARRCRSLEQLSLQMCVEITNGGLLDLTSRCTVLGHLDVTGCALVSGVGVPTASATTSTPRLALHYLDMSDCTRLDDTSLRLVVETCPQLQFLFLRRCSLITDAGLKSVSSYCLLLRELSVSDCTQLTDGSLLELGRLGPSLRYLSLAKCDRITDSGIRSLVRHCYRLRYLNLRGLDLVTDSSIEWLARSCTRLRSVDLGKCDISDYGLQSLSENCPNLKKLSVKGCTKVTDRGVGTLSYYCRGLQQLNIQEVVGVTVQGCRVVRGNCRRCIIEHTNPALSS